MFDLINNTNEAFFRLSARKLDAATECTDFDLDNTAVQQDLGAVPLAMAKPKPSTYCLTGTTSRRRRLFSCADGVA